MVVPVSSPNRHAAEKVWVVLPAYNEGKVIDPLLREIHAALTAAGRSNHTLIVVDDGSADDTAARVRALESELPVLLVPHAQNEGLGRALRTGLLAAVERAAPDDVVVTTEADGTQPTEVLPEMVRAVEEGHDFVVATPLVDPTGFRGVPFYRRFISRGANLLYANLFPIHTLHDYTNLVRAMRAAILQRAVRQYGIDGIISRRGFESVPELILKLRPLLPRILELPLVIDHSILQRRSQMPILRTIRASTILVGIEMLARLQRRLGDL
jgi:dolichol-phosphate mannosyltransferase